MTVTTEANRILAIEPNPDHVVSKGYACIKGLKMGDFAHSPDRLTTPLKKVDGRFHPIDWDTAIHEIAAKLSNIQERHGGESIAAYSGNPIGFSMWPMVALTWFLKAFGSDKLFTPGTQDCANKFAGGTLLFGGPHEQVFPDIDHTQLLIAVGTNPVISKMSFIQIPHPMKRIKAIEERGGKVYWVNPRKTESAKQAGIHIAIRPDTDVFFMLGFLNEVITRGAYDRNHVDAYMDGFDELATIAAAWTPERCAEATGIAAPTLRQMVSDYLAADGAALYHSTGVNQGRFGLMVYWLQEAINAISGNLDKRGGVLAGKQVIQRPAPKTEEATSRIDDIPYVNSMIPAGIMADEILTPGNGQVRAMFCLAGNPLLACAGSDRLAEAFSSLELFVCMDIVRNETAEYADYILPGLHGLERADIPFYFFTVMGLMPDRAFMYTDEIIPPPGEARDEALAFRQLCRKAGHPFAGSRVMQWVSNSAEWLAQRTGNSGRHSLEKLFYSLLARSARVGGLKTLRGHPDGMLLEPNQPGDYLGKRVATPNVRVQLAPPELVKRARELDAVHQEEVAQPNALKIIQKRERFSHNSWAHNVDEFIKGERKSNYLYMHSSDADERRLSTGDMARVSANGSAVEIPVKVDNDMMPGSVAVPHGWGHQGAKGLSTAQQTTGVNVNLIMPDGPASIEPISGMSHMNGVLVEVERVELP